MKLYLVIVIFSLTFFGCGTARIAISPHDPYRQLQKDINSVLSDSLFIPTRVSVKVVSLADEKILYDRESKMLMNPGSNIKLLTSAAALSVLDTNYQFKTAVFIDRNSSDGTVAENIYLKGYGDPDLTTLDLDSLAYTVHLGGITRISKNIIVDDSFFDDNYWGDGWAWDDESDPDAPYINALSVNKNCIRITLSANLNSISLSLEPKTNFVTVINKAKISNDSIRIPLEIRRLSLNNPNTVIIEGELSSYSRITQKLPLCRPEYYAGTLFKESLRRVGIVVQGNIVNSVVPHGLHEFAQKYQPIEKMVTNLNKISDNLSAENTLKVMGTIKNGTPGSAKSGLFLIRHFLSTLGIDTTKLSVVDGSGVSRYNLLTTDQIIQVLMAIYKQPRIFPMFYNSLPIAGSGWDISRSNGILSCCM